MNPRLQPADAVTSETKREARGRIFRGVDAEAVRRFLLENGAGEHAAGELVRTLGEEREACIRRTATAYILSGVFVMGGVIALSGIFNLHGGKWLFFVGAVGFALVIKGGAMWLGRDRQGDLSAMMPPDAALDSSTEGKGALTKTLPPAVGYGLLFVFVTAIVAIAAYVMYFRD